MGFVAIVKSTGKILEFQSEATPGTVVQNAINAGFLAGDIEEREVTYDEFIGMVKIDPTTLVQREIKTESDLITAKIVELNRKEALAVLKAEGVNFKHF